MNEEMTDTNAPLDEGMMQPIVEEFFRDGVVLVRAILTASECELLREKTDEIFADPQKKAASSHGIDMVISSPLLHDRIFRDLFVRQPILGLTEAILGKECRFCGQSIIRNAPGQAISNWHVDDCNMLDFPLPAGVARHDARIRMPVFWLSVQIPLTDVESPDDGPTEVVRGSHYSGRLPDTQNNLRFDGREAEPMLCKAGDAYLFNHQIWHRGMPNNSQRTRYLLQLQYARGGTFASRFQGLPDTPQVGEIMQDADETTMRVLGRTAPTYGL